MKTKVLAKGQFNVVQFDEKSRKAHKYDILWVPTESKYISMVVGSEMAKNRAERFTRRLNGILREERKRVCEAFASDSI